MQYGDISIYDENFNLLCVVPKYLSVNWQIFFKSYGTGEVHLPKTEEYVELFTTNPHLFIEQGAFQGVVTGIKIEEDCAVFVKTPEWFFTKFIAEEYVAPNGQTAGEVACELVRRALGNQISLVTTGEETSPADCSGFVLEEATDLYSALLLCLSDEKTGFSFSFDTEEKCFYFCLRTAQENKETVFGEEYRSYTAGVYVRDIQDVAEGYLYYHKLECGGNYDPIENEPQLIETPENYGKYYRITENAQRFGLQLNKGDVLLCKRLDGKFETAKEAKPFPVRKTPDGKGIFHWSTIVTAKTEDEVKHAMGKLKPRITISGTAKTHEYGRDYQVGDLVTVQFSAGNFVHSEEKLVSGVHIFEDAQTVGFMPEFTSVTKTEE